MSCSTSLSRLGRALNDLCKYPVCSVVIQGDVPYGMKSGGRITKGEIYFHGESSVIKTFTQMDNEQNYFCLYINIRVFSFRFALLYSKHSYHDIILTLEVPNLRSSLRYHQLQIT